jgi:anti-anti-sigma factor
MPHNTQTSPGQGALKLTLTSIDKDGIIRVAVEGPITYEAVIAEKNPLAGLLGETWSSNRVLLNLERTHFIDSAAIGWLIATHKEFKASGGKFIVHSVRPPVRQVLDLLKVGKIVTLADSEDAARKAA